MGEIDDAGEIGYSPYWLKPSCNCGLGKPLLQQLVCDREKRPSGQGRHLHLNFYDLGQVVAELLGSFSQNEKSVTCCILV